MTRELLEKLSDLTEDGSICLMILSSEQSDSTFGLPACVTNYHTDGCCITQAGQNLHNLRLVIWLDLTINFFEKTFKCEVLNNYACLYEQIILALVK